MTIFLLILSGLLSYYIIAVPIAERHAARRKAEILRSYEAFQLDYVRRHFESMRHMSLEEIREGFDYQTAYNDLTVRRTYIH